MSPRFLGASGLATVDSLDIEELEQAPPLEGVSVLPFGGDVMIDGYRPGWLQETLKKTEQRAQEVLHVHRIS